MQQNARAKSTKLNHLDGSIMITANKKYSAESLKRNTAKMGTLAVSTVRVFSIFFSIFRSPYFSTLS